MFGEVGNVAAPKVTHTTLVRLLTYWRKETNKELCGANIGNKLEQLYFFPTAVNQRVSFQATFM